MSTRSLLIAITILWIGIHLAYGQILIVHDSWQHIFPIVHAVAKNASCGNLPAWLNTVDNGSPTLIYLISFSLTQIVRLPLLYLWSCLHPGVIDAMYMYKAQIYLAYFLFATSMYFLGRVLFEHRLSAVYLFTAALFAGLCLDSAHSNQVVSELFWVPWILIAGVLYHRNAGSKQGSWYLNTAALFFCIQALDQYPHFIVLVTAIAVALYLSLAPKALSTALPHLPRLWPALIVLLVMAAQLLIVKQTIADYAPSLRSDLVVNPKAFGETGFVQLTALIGTFLPITFTAGFDTFGDSMAAVLQSAFGKPVGRKFIFRLDILLFYIGIIPTLLAIVFALKPGNRHIKKGWLIFAAVCFLVSLQQSKLYLLLFHVPFFNVFRSYFLYIVFVVFAVLVMSAYGLDYLLGARPEARAALVQRATLWLVGFCTASALILLGLTLAAPDPRGLMRTLGLPLVMDAGLILVGITAFRQLVQAGGARLRLAAVVLLGLVIPQIAYFAMSYEIVGMTVSQVYAKFGLDEKDIQVTSSPQIDANTYRRKLCTKFAQCYLSQSDTVSLNTDLQGTFLRNWDEPLFQSGLARPVVEALTGLAHPVYWMSRGVKAYDNRVSLVATLNAHQSQISSLLYSVAYISSSETARMPARPSRPEGTAEIVKGIRGIDSFVLEYTADYPSFMNAAVNYDPHWRASVDGKALTITKGNFGGIVSLIPAGKNKVKFEYSNLYHDLLLFSRYVFLVLAAVAIVKLLTSRTARGV